MSAVFDRRATNRRTADAEVEIHRSPDRRDVARHTRRLACAALRRSRAGASLCDATGCGAVSVRGAHEVSRVSVAARGAGAAGAAPPSGDAVPELLATAPNQLWRWDITKLKGPTTWSWYQWYVMLDVCSRYVVGWMLAPNESGVLAEDFIAKCCVREHIGRDQLTIHADRGPAMTAKPVAHLRSDLGITKLHSRPHVSNDTPYSEAHFKTLKYRPDFPTRFGSLEDARAHLTDFFAWYNTEHRHSSLGLPTPHDVHPQLADARNAARALVLASAYVAHPDRFVRRPPTPRALPTAAWINPPRPSATTTEPP